jgi:polysaccharide export outer membrane protein
MDVMTQTIRLSAGGEITFPYLGTVVAKDMTASELEETLAKQLREKNLIKDPQVLISVVEYHAKPIYVLGEVDRPGQYIMTQQLYLMDAILLAGGLDFTAARYGFLHRRDETSEPLPESSITIKPTTFVAAPGSQVVKIDLRPLKEGHVLDPNPALHAGDVFLVPERKVELCYVVGDVGRPGAFELPEAQDLLVTQAISSAGGPTKTAKMSEGILVRYSENGERREIPVDFAAILNGREPDFKVQSDDIVFIPGSAAKTVGYGMLNVIPRIAQSALIYGILY